MPDDLEAYEAKEAAKMDGFDDLPASLRDLATRAPIDIPTQWLWRDLRAHGEQWTLAQYRAALRRQCGVIGSP